MKGEANEREGSTDDDLEGSGEETHVGQERGARGAGCCTSLRPLVLLNTTKGGEREKERK